MDFLSSPLYISIKNFLLRDYPPAVGFEDADLFMDSFEIFEKLKTSFPGDYFLEDITLLLIELEYETQSIGEMKCVWLIRKK